MAQLKKITVHRTEKIQIELNREELSVINACLYFCKDRGSLYNDMTVEEEIHTSDIQNLYSDLPSTAIFDFDDRGTRKVCLGEAVIEEVDIAHTPRSPYSTVESDPVELPF